MVEAVVPAAGGDLSLSLSHYAKRIPARLVRIPMVAILPVSILLGAAIDGLAGLAVAAATGSMLLTINLIRAGHSGRAAVEQDPRACIVAALDDGIATAGRTGPRPVPW